MTKTIFEEMGGTYRQVGDYLLPNITVPAEEEIEPIGLWGKRHARHLKAVSYTHLTLPTN